jgi:hypothetical protein
MDDLDSVDTVVYLEDWLRWKHTFYFERGW